MQKCLQSNGLRTPKCNKVGIFAVATVIAQGRKRSQYVTCVCAADLGTTGMPSEVSL